MKQERQATASRAANDTVNKWVNENAAALFINGDQANGLAPYGEKFKQMEDTVKQWSRGENLTRPELHRRTLRMMSDLDITPDTVGAAAGVPQSTDDSFMGQAPQPNPQVHNTLQDFAAIKPPEPPTLKLGKSGLPSLMHHIQSNPNHLG
jgi:hypothetical protein